MSIPTPYGINISYESEDLIAELEEEIALYGSEQPAIAVIVDKSGAPIITDYGIDMADIGKLSEEETTLPMSLGKILEILKAQDRII